MAEENIKQKLHTILANPEKKEGTFTTFGVKIYREDKIEYKEINELRKELIEAWEKILKEYENYGIKYMFEVWEGSIHIWVFVPLENNKGDSIFIIENKAYNYGKYKVLEIDWDENSIALYFPK